MTAGAPPASLPTPPEALTGVRASLAVAGAVFLVVAALSWLRVGHGAPDFYVFWAAARHWQAPYDPAVIQRLEAMIHLGGTWPFAYPPTFLLFVFPFTLLPMTTAYSLWAGLSAALFAFAAARMVRPAWAAGLLLVSPPVFFAAELGQTTLPVGAALIAGWRLIDRRPAIAGVLFALAACIKPQAMILAPVVLWGRWRVLAWMAGAGLAIVAASLVFGLGPWLQWPHVLADFGRIAPKADRANPSALLGAPWWAALAGVFGAVFAWRNRNLLGMVGGAFCLTPYAHAYDLAPLAPLAAAWLLERRRHGWGLVITGGALLAGLVATPMAATVFFAALALAVALASGPRRDRTWRIIAARAAGRAGPGADMTAPGLKRETLARLGLAVLAFVVWTVFAAWHERVKPADFYVFWAAARHWRAPYDPALVAQLKAALHVTGAWPFVYPPTFLLFLQPLAALPLQLAYPLWTGLSVALFIFAAAHVVRPPWAVLALFIVPPVVLAISPGQTSLVVGAAAIGGFALLDRRPALAGLLFAVAACIKPQAMILAPIVLWGHWRALRWAAIGGLGLVAASLIFGPGRWPEWVHALADFRRVLPATDRVNPSALAAGPVWAAALALLGVSLAWTSRDMAGLVGGALCLTPYAHAYDLAPLAPLALAWLIEHRRGGWGRAAAGAGLLAGLVATPAAGLAFVLGLAAIAAPWRKLRAPAAPALSRSYEA